MSVNVNFKPSTNVSKWEAIKSGDFAVLEGTPEHPIPAGLYRVFIITEPEPPNHRNIFIVPLFEGPFEESMFPYMLNNFPLPTLVQKASRVSIDAEVNQ
jgi:hypothetical protein